MSAGYYQDLIVWQKSMELVKEVYRLSRFLPKEETYALSDQMRRAAVSIPSNIAEGQERNTTREFVQFLSVARGSRAELETQLILCVHLHYMQQSDVETALGLCREIGKMLNRLILNLKAKE